MSRFIYSLLFYLMTPFIFVRLWWRGIKAPDYRQRWSERLAFGQGALRESLGNKPVVWVHSVSVGETLAAVALVRALKKDYPQVQLLVTTTTPTGSERVRCAFGRQVVHCYLPYDLPGAVRRFLDLAHPRLALFMETEMWPNMLAACHQRGIPSMLINARMSTRSFGGYQRVRRLSQPMFASLDAVAAQTADDAQRLMALGCRSRRLVVTGNIKYDQRIAPDLQERSFGLRRVSFGLSASNNRPPPVLIAASTHAGEDERVLQLFANLRTELTDLRLILVPRHPERFDTVGRLCTEAGFKITRRSLGAAISHCTATSNDIFIGDTMGELLLFYGMADVAFVGGSLVNVGGHNILEPAAMGLPVAVGPYTHNFTEVTQLMLRENAAVQGTVGELEPIILRWFLENETRIACGHRGRRVVEQNKGALGRVSVLLKPMLDKIESCNCNHLEL